MCQDQHSADSDCTHDARRWVTSRGCTLPPGMAAGTSVTSSGRRGSAGADTRYAVGDSVSNGLVGEGHGHGSKQQQNQVKGEQKLHLMGQSMDEAFDVGRGKNNNSTSCHMSRVFLV